MIRYAAGTTVGGCGQHRCAGGTHQMVKRGFVLKPPHCDPSLDQSAALAEIPTGGWEKQPISLVGSGWFTKSRENSAKS
jgi:hypothetical protein